MQLPHLHLILAIIGSATAVRHHNANAVTSASCESSACVEYINTCSKVFGGCYAACSGYAIPTYSDPGCPVTQANQLAATSTCDSTVCIDKINSCGLRNGGCYEACTWYPTPSFAVPACDTTTITPTATLTISAIAGNAQKARHVVRTA